MGGMSCSSRLRLILDFVVSLSIIYINLINLLENNFKRELFPAFLENYVSESFKGFLRIPL